MDIRGRAERVDPGNPGGVGRGKGAEGIGDSAVIDRRTALDRVSDRAACSEAGGQRCLVTFEQDHLVGPQAIAAKAMECEDRRVSQRSGRTLIGPA